ncbi:glycosyltransferase family 4 protein [Terrabacter sp. MAHUQ-38]|uniref:glycosyltransferase family 4 protein n=1 Tax=unclassified Terrabacter TaxID=2630222 RepID=UPI00165DB7C7|nr:glycosyltransferase family 4 protein [Terrabacter sp. MAHUQ-38]MBC9821920.1 glycosyltransferase family 4 protein [Terrabacter sp. MAHUQ-38]
MRILLLTHHYEPELGAPQQRWGAMVRRFTRAGHDVVVVAPSPHYSFGGLMDDAEQMRPGSVHRGAYGESVHRVAFRPHTGRLGSRLLDQVVSSLDSTRTVLTRVRRIRPDVIIATAPALPTLFSGALLARTIDVPLVTEMRDAWPDLLAVADDWNAAAVPAPSRRAAVFRPPVLHAAGALMTALQRRSAAVVTTTESFASALRSRGVRSVHVVRNGAHELPGYRVHSPRDPDGELRVLYLGTVGRAQGLGTAVVAARLAHAAGVSVRLRIVGAGAEHEAVAAMASKGDVPIEILGQVPKAQVADHYAWADTLLVALRPWAPLELTVPSKLYEAMSIGIHVTGMVDGEAAAILRTAGMGAIVPPGDANSLAETWAKLANDPSQLYVGDSGREWTDEHANDDRLAERYLSILEDVVAQHA